VHLKEWPQVKRGLFARFFGKGDAVLAEMKDVRSIVTKALEARDKAGIKVRQPLNLLEIGSNISKELRDIIREEVNVKQVMPAKDLAPGEVRLDTVITPELQHEGEVRELLRAVQGLRKEGGLNPGDAATILVSATDGARVLIESAKDDLERIASVKGVVFTDNVEGVSVKLGGGTVNVRLG
jgi:isoleucyl-tRNA synthetase